jgi:hypothetical protein
LGFLFRKKKSFLLVFVRKGNRTGTITKMANHNGNVPTVWKQINMALQSEEFRDLEPSQVVVALQQGQIQQSHLMMQLPMEQQIRKALQTVKNPLPAAPPPHAPPAPMPTSQTNDSVTATTTAVIKNDMAINVELSNDRSRHDAGDTKSLVTTTTTTNQTTSKDCFTILPQTMFNCIVRFLKLRGMYGKQDEWLAVSRCNKTARTMIDLSLAAQSHRVIHSRRLNQPRMWANSSQIQTLVLDFSKWFDDDDDTESNKIPEWVKNMRATDRSKPAFENLHTLTIQSELECQKPLLMIKRSEAFIDACLVHAPNLRHFRHIYLCPLHRTPACIQNDGGDPLQEQRLNPKIFLTRRGIITYGLAKRLASKQLRSISSILLPQHLHVNSSTELFSDNSFQREKISGLEQFRAPNVTVLPDELKRLSDIMSNLSHLEIFGDIDPAYTLNVLNYWPTTLIHLTAPSCHLSSCFQIKTLLWINQRVIRLQSLNLNGATIANWNIVFFLIDSLPTLEALGVVCSGLCSYQLTDVVTWPKRTLRLLELPMPHHINATIHHFFQGKVAQCINFHPMHCEKEEHKKLTRGGLASQMHLIRTDSRLYREWNVSIAFMRIMQPLSVFDHGPCLAKIDNDKKCSRRKDVPYDFFDALKDIKANVLNHHRAYWCYFQCQHQEKRKQCRDCAIYARKPLYRWENHDECEVVDVMGFD